MVDVVELAAKHMDDSELGLMVQALVEEIMRLRASTIRAQVSEFHRVYGQPIGSKPMVPDRATVALRVSLISEEFCEMLDAIYSGDAAIEDIRESIEELTDPYRYVPEVDLIDLVDAWADLDYVVEGSRLAFGVDGEPIAAEVQRSNLSKLGEDGESIRRKDGKIQKGPNFSPPDIAGELKKQGWQP